MEDLAKYLGAYLSANSLYLSINFTILSITLAAMWSAFDVRTVLKVREKYLVPNTLARANLLCMKNWGAHCTMVSYLEK